LLLLFCEKGKRVKKADAELQEPHLAPDEEHQLARLIPIRTETTLTRYPFHRIAKRGKVKIKHTRRSERGKVSSLWEVRNPPGPLAYKIDTLVINRRIDEMRSRGGIQQLFKVGSLRDICEELGIKIGGKTADAIKEALRENAFAGITCKLEFIGNDGSTRHFEFDTTRYTVIFTGQKLPNDKRADAVYIELHPRFHEMLLHSRTRPLDYEYLKALPPAAQRLYELLSFAIFGALKHGRAHALMLYSEFCQSTPLTRYYKWEQVKKQLYKIHQPHKQSGYIKSVEFEETRDEDGRPDWLMRYKLGPRARREFREFNEKGKEKLLSSPRPCLIEDQAPRGEGKKVEQLSMKQENLLASLLAFNVGEKTARELVKKLPEQVERELEAFPYRKLDGIENPAGLLIAAIRSGDYSQPPKLEAKRQERAATAAKKGREDLEKKFRPEYIETYLKPLRDSLSSENPEAFERYMERCLNFDRFFPERPDELRATWKLIDLETMAEEFPEFGFLTFAEWLKKEHQKTTNL
jgi:hypothetical protein